MAKITLTDVGSGYDLTPINNNFTSLEDELQNKVLYRNNPAGEPNQMEDDLDMNSYNLLNVNLLNGEDVSNLSGNLTTVANLDTEINTVAGISADVTTVAGDSAAITSVSSNIADVQTVATDISNINTVAGSIADVSTVATNVAAVTNVSDNIDDVNSFAQLYLGSKTSDPALDNDGNALVDGALYFNTTANGGNGELRIYDLTGATWKAAAFSATAANGVTYNNATSGLAATEVQSALDEIDGDLDAHLASSTAHDATEITYDNSTSGLAATDVQAAIDEVEGSLGTVAGQPYWEDDVTINDGDFASNPFTLKCRRIGDVVTIGVDSVVNHASTTQANSNALAIPSTYVPTSGNQFNVYFMVSSVVCMVHVNTNGSINLKYYDWSGTSSSQTNSVTAFSMTYMV